MRALPECRSRIADPRSLAPSLRQYELDQVQRVTARDSSISAPCRDSPGEAPRLDDATLSCQLDFMTSPASNKRREVAQPRSFDRASLTSTPIEPRPCARRAGSRGPLVIRQGNAFANPLWRRIEERIFRLEEHLFGVYGRWFDLFRTELLRSRKGRVAAFLQRPCPSAGRGPLGRWVRSRRLPWCSARTSAGGRRLP